MAVSCEHNSKLRLEGLCKPCSDKKPYMVFRMVHESCNSTCTQCGYFWGPGNEQMNDQKVIWSKP